MRKFLEGEMRKNVSDNAENALDYEEISAASDKIWITAGQTKSTLVYNIFANFDVSVDLLMVFSAGISSFAQFSIAVGMHWGYKLATN